jgi:outer membrane biosynthesis protein TonB
LMGMEKYKEYMRKNLRTPVTGPSGRVKLVFQVGTDGSLWDFVVIQSVSQPCDEEAIRIVREGPAWRPALQHGHRKVPSQGYVEVEF